MRIKKLKRKSRFLFIKIVAPILILLILSSLLLYKLPTVPFFKKPIISPLAKGEPSQGSNLEALLKIKNIPFTSIRRFSDYYSVMLADGGEVFISSKKDLTIQIDSLQPGMTIVCGDSHTSTHGAFGALAFGIGTTE